MGAAAAWKLRHRPHRNKIPKQHPNAAVVAGKNVFRGEEVRENEEQAQVSLAPCRGLGLCAGLCCNGLGL